MGFRGFWVFLGFFASCELWRVWSDFGYFYVVFGDFWCGFELRVV